MLKARVLLVITEIFKFLETQMKSMGNEMCGSIDVGSKMILSGSRDSLNFEANEKNVNEIHSIQSNKSFNSISSSGLLGSCEKIQVSPSLYLPELENQIYNLFLVNKTNTINDMYEKDRSEESDRLEVSNIEVSKNIVDKKEYKKKVNLDLDVMPLERTRPIDFSSMKFIRCNWCKKRHLLRYDKQHKIISLCISCNEKKRIMKMKKNDVKDMVCKSKLTI